MTARRAGDAGPGAEPVTLVVLTYGGLTVLALGIGVVRGAPNVFVATPWLSSLRDGAGGTSWAGHATSFLAGLAMAAAVIAGTRWLVFNKPWAAALHEDLRPFVRSLGARAIAPTAIASSLGEEALFRGALVPILGVAISSIVFGLLHQVRGRSRWTWVIFATAIGAVFGLVFVVTGSLVGPLVAHAAINAVNLRFLLDHAPRRDARLGGLLR